MTEQQVLALLVRAFHTFWQAFLATFILGLLPVVSDILNHVPISGSEAALIALVVASLAAGFSAVKNILVKPVEAK